MMDLLTATSRVKNALSNRDYIGAYTHLHLKGGRVYASDGALTASAPISEALEHVVPAEELDKALQIFGSDAEYIWSEDTLLVKKGRRKMTIRLLKPDQVSLLEPTVSKQMVPKDFKQCLKKIRPFLSDDASRPWALTAWLRPDAGGKHVCIATNNITVAEVSMEDSSRFESSIDIQIPNYAIDFLLNREQSVTHIGVENNKVSFWFEDDSQVTAQLFAVKMPEAVPNILSLLEKELAGVSLFQLTDEWREAYKSIVMLSPEELTIGPEIMKAGRKQCILEIEINSHPPRDTTKAESHWNPKFLSPVVDLATYIDLGSYPKASGFFGPGVRGLIIGKLV